ncbi:MAG: hypothetical protein ACRERC_13360 [Candidatus Binatia bacterium]
MARLDERRLSAEATKHFHGTPAERMATAMRLGREVLALFLATQPTGTSRPLARQILQRNTHRGRRPSAVTG